jgi:hypothetical protein
MENHSSRLNLCPEEKSCPLFFKNFQVIQNCLRPSYVVEAAFPWRSLLSGRNPAGRKLRANFCRGDNIYSENSSWSPVENSFCSPRYFGTLIFEK